MSWLSPWGKDLRTLSSPNPAIEPFSIYTDKLETYVHTETCTWVFIAASVITDQIWKPLCCLSVGGSGQRNPVYPDNRVLFSDKRNIIDRAILLGNLCI